MASRMVSSILWVVETRVEVPHDASVRGGSAGPLCLSRPFFDVAIGPGPSRGLPCAAALSRDPHGA